MRVAMVGRAPECWWGVVFLGGRGETFWRGLWFRATGAERFARRFRGARLDGASVDKQRWLRACASRVRLLKTVAGRCLLVVMRMLFGEEKDSGKQGMSI